MSSKNLYTHSFFPYPAKFPPEPIRRHILKLSKEGDTVLDPFCGSGTVLVEGLLNKRNAYGIDLNPVSALISRAKSNVYSKEDIEYINSLIEELKGLKGIETFWARNIVTQETIPNYKNISLWFKDNMLYELTAIREQYLNNTDINTQLNELLWMAFLKIIVSVSNQDTDTRYTSVDKPELVDGYAIKKFAEALQTYSTKLEEYLPIMKNIDANIQVFEGDVKNKIQEIENNSIDLVVTSPPYINTFDYYLYHKHRIFWMEKSPQLVRKQEIGCHHRIDSMSYDKAYKEYYESLNQLFNMLYTKLKKHAHVVMLIGDGIVKKKLVKADEMINEIGPNNKFSIVEIQSRPIKEVSKGFIKGRNLNKKKHHTIILRRE